MYDNIPHQEKAIAISVGKKGTDREIYFDRLAELESLAETAGAEIVEKFYQDLEHPYNATLIGKGKIEEINLALLENNITLVISDNELSPVQLRNLEKAFNVKVIDRSGLILDIFANHAKTQEAKTQVELAQSQYLLPRLTRMWTHLSKQYGGIGTKGPGETQIETDRRTLRIKIQHLKDKLDQIATQKEQQTKQRTNMPRFALVGYTNAGKSTLMNTMTDAGVFVEDKLFATLDTTVRSFELPGGRKSLISDTVGFIRDLPAHLVASFRSTLKESAEADILIHVVDITHKNYREHIRVVNDTLEYLKIYEKPLILVFNKIDLIEDYGEIRGLEKEYNNTIFISASRGINIQGLLALMQQEYDRHSNIFRFILPYSDMELISDIYSRGEILNREDKDHGILFEVKIPGDKTEYFEHHFGKYIL